MNPYRINPSYAGVDGKGALFLTYRTQWTGLEGAPTTMNLSYHNATKSNLNFGLNVNNDSHGIVNATSLMLTLGLTLPVAKDQYIRFGLSGGVAMNSYDLDKLGDALVADPALENILQNRFNVLADVGLSYHLKFFNLGVAMPNLLANSYDSLSTFEVGNFAALDNMIIHSNYRFYFGFEDRFAIEPHVIYRLRKGTPSQYEGALIFHMSHAVWLGATYKQNYGLSGTGGVKINGLFALGYSFGIANTGANQINKSTHEVQINFLFGQKRRHKHIYSFTDSKKPIVKKTRRQLLAEQHKAERERIEAERAAEAKAAAEKAEEERQAKIQAEKEAAERQERERIAEQQRAEAERMQQQDANRTAQQQQAENARLEQERQAKEAEQKRIAQQRAEAERQQQEEANRTAQQQQAENARLEQERRAKEAEQERIAQQRAETERQQQEEANRIAQQQKEAEEARLAQQEQKTEPVPVTKTHETKIDSEGNVESAFTTNEKVSVKRGGHFLELQPGEYVVVGVFAEFEHAELYSDRLFEHGYKTRFGFISETRMWYVHLYQSDDIDAARGERDKYRKLNLFRKAWVLSVE